MMISRASVIVLSAMVAGLGALALLAANNPDAFTGAGSPGAAALEAALYFVALVAALLLAATDRPL